MKRRFSWKMPATDSLEELRRWIEDRRAAARHELEDVRERGAYVDDPVKSAIELIAIAAEMYGWPISEDAVQQREDEKARANWTRLRRAFGVS